MTAAVVAWLAGAGAGWFGHVAKLRLYGPSAPVVARRFRGGFVLRRARDIEHYCAPPGSWAVDQTNSCRQRIEGHAAERWTAGDVWVCDCGKGWTVAGYGYQVEWRRTESEDLV